MSPKGSSRLPSPADLHPWFLLMLAMRAISAGRLPARLTAAICDPRVSLLGVRAPIYIMWVKCPPIKNGDFP